MLGFGPQMRCARGGTERKERAMDRSIPSYLVAGGDDEALERQDA